MGREPAAGRRIEILETAVNLFLRQGYLRTSMQDVAEAAKVSKATLYQLFESKEGLGTEAASLLTMRMLDRVEAAAEQEHPFSQELLKQSIQIRMEQFAQRSRLAEEILFSMEEGQKEQYLMPLVQNSLQVFRCFTRVIMRTFGLGSDLMAGELTFVLNGLLREYMAVNGEEGLKLEEDAVCDLIIDDYSTADADFSEQAGWRSVFHISESAEDAAPQGTERRDPGLRTERGDFLSAGSVRAD